MISRSNLIKINDYLWEIPKTGAMRVPARIFIDERMLTDILEDQSLEQIINVATLPGILKYSLAMPDIHEGYGFPIGGVAAFDIEAGGIISPGGVGFDINCGVRLLRTGKKYNEIKNQMADLATEFFHEIPSGVGRGGKLRLTDSDLDLVLKEGVDKMIAMGYGTKADKENCEAGGRLPEAEPAFVSSHAKSRGRDQLGTMGAGNHFVEIGVVDEIFDVAAANAMGLFKDEVTIMIHCGSRGLGHQVATDYIRVALGAMGKYGIRVSDRQLACVPFSSPEGQKYFKAMSAAANFAWANRQLITEECRTAWEKTFGKGSNKELEVVYDVAHNLAKVESHGGKKLIVHRKGATRSFPPRHSETPSIYKEIGQPVLIPGSMGTASYVLVGNKEGMELSFGSSCHGAGRKMSRTKARHEVSGSELKKELEGEGIVIRSGSMAGLAEEAPIAYKDVDEVVNVVQEAGLAKKAVRLRPVAVIKG